jgi:hypothetical protein
MRLDKGDRVVSVVCHDRAAPPLVVDADGVEHRFHLPEPAHRAQKGRKVLKRFKVAELAVKG